MNWLLICSDKNKMKKMRSAVEHNFKDAVLSAVSPEESERRSGDGKLGGITHCVISVEERSREIDFIAGFMCGASVPVYTDLQDLSREIDCSDKLVVSEDFTALVSYLGDQKGQIISDFEKKEAYRYLFEHGLPFSPDCFALQIEKENTELCACYLRAGMDVNTRNGEGTPMLNVACRCESLELVKWLVAHGCDVDPVSEDRGYTPLMDAVWKGNADIAGFLIKQGADVNRLSKDGQTMIVLAVGADKIDLCRLLVENGADVDIPDAMGMSAYAYASLFKKEAILALLEKYHKE